MNARRPRVTITTALLAVVVAGTLAACGSGSEPDAGATGTAAADGGTLTVYSGRSEELVGPLLEAFEKETGIEVEVRYGTTAEMAAQLLEEGDGSPADVFFSQDAGALQAVQDAGLLATLPQSTLDAVAPTYRSTDGGWIGISGRARVLAYNTELVPTADLPSSVAELADPAWRGKVGIAPTNASFQSFVTAMRVTEGEAATRAWLEALVANDVQSFEGNGDVRDAVDAGTVSLGLVNHYYVYEKRAEVGADALSVDNHFLAPGDPGSLVNVAGVGILATSDATSDAQAFVDYLLSEAGQTYFSETTFEYPLVAGIAVAEGLPALEDVQGPDITLGDLADVAGTQALLTEVGLL